MAFHDTKKKYSLTFSIHKVILTCLGGPFFSGHGVYFMPSYILGFIWRLFWRMFLCCVTFLRLSDPDD